MAAGIYKVNIKLKEDGSLDEDFCRKELQKAIDKENETIDVKKKILKKILKKSKNFHEIADSF